MSARTHAADHVDTESDVVRRAVDPDALDVFARHDRPAPVREVDPALVPDPAHLRTAAFSAEFAAVAATGNPLGVRWCKAHRDTRLVTVTHQDWTLIARRPGGPYIALVRDVPQPLDVTGLDALSDHLTRLAEDRTRP
ncbi:hypothetical protein [Embleya sp. NPDC020630]|uniref:hypothetical protein n=1 Tax=Embleya sp. NPDC020630 TaxID=3363979 RepID=UPI0037A9778F